MNQLNIQKFIKSNNNWFELLQKEPYYIVIKYENGLYNFNYSQLNSDFNNQIVRECRGLILEDKTFNTVCVPFYKFGNYGEEYADNIDWNTARVQEKLDGTLICMYYYNNRWNYSTRSNIDAYNSPLSGNVLYKSFGELFNHLISFDVEVLNKNYTYMFELCSPYNQVVIRYNKPMIYHIGTRDNITLQEINEDIGVIKPDEYNISTLDDCIKSAKLFDGHEGYVIVDNNWHRIKVKNPSYVAMHHTINNHTITIKRILDIIDSGDKEEFLNYFPEYNNDFSYVEYYISLILYQMQKTIDKTKEMCYNSRKEKAKYIQHMPYSYVGFMSIDNNNFKAKDYWDTLDNNKKEKMIKEIRDKYEK